MGRITCIIPCYNLGRFVETAVNSAINQDTNFERIIVIDDASTDDSRDYIHRLPDKIDKMLNMLVRNDSTVADDIVFDGCAYVREI